MLKRIIVAVIGVPFLLFVLCWSPSWATAILICLLSILATHEFMSAVASDNKDRNRVILSELIGICIILMTYFKKSDYASNTLNTVFQYLIAILAFVFVVTVIRNFGTSNAYSYVDICTILVSGVLIPISFSTLLSLRVLENGKGLVMIPLVAAFSSDTMALFGGMMFGKRKLAPKVSPKKTQEGALSGVAGGMVGMIIFRIIFFLVTSINLNILWCIVLGFFGAVAGQLGDLTFSVVKREFGIKDYGKLLPGHGGVLDRFDSVLLASPLMLFLIQHINLY